MMMTTCDAAERAGSARWVSAGALPYRVSSSTVPMTVVYIRVVRMPVGHRGVDMGMTVRLAP